MNSCLPFSSFGPISECIPFDSSLSCNLSRNLVKKLDFRRKDKVWSLRRKLKWSLVLNGHWCEPGFLEPTSISTWASKIATANRDHSSLLLMSLRKTSIFKCHHRGSARPDSRRLQVGTDRLSALGWTLTRHTMEIQGRQTPLTFVWRPVWCLGSRCDGWRTGVNCPSDGDLCQCIGLWHYSGDHTFLSITFCFTNASSETCRDRCVLRKERVCGDIRSVRKCIRTGEIIWLVLTDLSLCLFLTHTAVKLTVRQISFLLSG